MAFKLFSQGSKFFSQERKQQLLIIILIVVALTVLFVLYFGFLRSPTTGEPGAVGSTIDGKIFLEDITKKIDFDIDFLKEPYFQTLKIHGEWPLSIEEKSRPNPFLPY